MHYGYGNGGDHWGPGIFMIIVMLAFLGALAWIIVTFLRQRGVHPHTHTRSEVTIGESPDALRILDERLARGDIEEEEYKRRRDLLKENR